jgi:hypothetical protein
MPDTDAYEHWTEQEKTDFMMILLTALVNRNPMSEFLPNAEIEAAAENRSVQFKINDKGVELFVQEKEAKDA